MRVTAVFIAAFLLWPSLVGSQTNTGQVPLKNEPHHTLVFENGCVRLFHLQLQANEVTETHRHSAFYAYFSLGSVAISNEVAGHAPVVTKLEPGELRTSKGGFNVAERNISSERADIFVVEPEKEEGNGFSAPVSIPMHDAGIVELYSGPAMRAYSVGIGSSGQLGEHTEMYDSLLVALAPLIIRETTSGSGSTDWNMKAGETRWIGKGISHSETNTGPAPAAFMVFEFN